MTDKVQKEIDTRFLGHPNPLFSLSMVEVWERFSYYGIRALLVLFISDAVVNGGLGIDKNMASTIVGIFAGSLYLAALPGGYLADNYFGQKKATLIGAILIACGHISIGLSYFVTELFFIGLVLIVLGTGLFKTCATVMVGMLYKNDDKRRDTGFTIFYMGINIGALIAPIVCGAVQKEWGWHLGLTAGGAGMMIALIIFYFKTIPDLEEYSRVMNNDRFLATPMKTKKMNFYMSICIIAFILFIGLCVTKVIIINPVIIANYMVYVIAISALLYFLYLLLFKNLDKKDIKNLCFFLVLFIASTAFWSIFEQQATTLNLFTDTYIDRQIFTNSDWTIPTAWFQAINSFFIIILAPIIGSLWIFLSKKNINFHSITKFALGMIGAALGFGIMFLASNTLLENGQLENSLSPMWLVTAYLLLTIGELCLSPIGLSAMTAIAPKVIRGQVMGLWFISISLGNVIAGIIGSGFNPNQLETLPALFGQCVVMALIISLILLIIKNPIKKALKD